MPSAFLLAAPCSGAGKTTVTLALLAALRARGLAVQPFKAGPDYIDPAHHARITGRASHNLDTWMLPVAANRAVFRSAAAGADVAVVEGVMGLYDGVDGTRPEGSSAHLAQALDLPVVLVVDARSMARSAAALVLGFTRFEPGLRFAGVIWNRVGSASHRRILDEALEGAGLPLSFGAIPRTADASLPERHLGLVTPEDAGLPEGFGAALARLAEEHLDIDRLLAATRASANRPSSSANGPPRGTRVPIAVARDAAFCFYYEENFKILEGCGAELVPFRPVDGEGVPPGAKGLYLGGGYPEVHAERLSRNEAFRARTRELHAAGLPIYAECGGFMALCREVADLEGRRFPMVGLFPAAATMASRGFRLGYREVQVQGIPRLSGQTARGHEFHYSTVDAIPDDIRRVYRVWNARGEEAAPEGYLCGSALASYVHLHFGSNPDFPRLFFMLG